MLPLSLLEFACFEAAFSECLQFSEQSGRNCIEVAYRSVWHIQEKAGLPNDDIVIIWRDSLLIDFPNGGPRGWVYAPTHTLRDCTTWRGQAEAPPRVACTRTVARRRARHAGRSQRMSPPHRTTASSRQLR
jgi:hypothetical protein